MSVEIIKISAVIIVVAVFITALRNRLGEYSILLTIAAITVVLVTVCNNLFGAIGEVQDLFTQNGNDTIYFTTALKALGISYIATFSADVCNDFGLSALAQTAEISGKIIIFILSLPLITLILEAALKFVRL